MTKHIFLPLAVLFLLFIPLYSTQTEDLSYPLTYFQLDNGLNVILAEDYSFPVVSVAVAYHIGSINEPENKSGLAHLLETLMFQGSRNVGRMQHINFINRTGGNFNAVTTPDRTVFHQTVPANQLELVLWLESDRMYSLNISREKVEWAKQTLIEGIRFRKMDSPYLSNALYFSQLLFGDYSYNHPVMGFETDLRNISLQDVRSFFSTYYRPNNAVICISGHIDKTSAKELVHKYFSSIPPGPRLMEPPKKEFPDMMEDVNFSEQSSASSPGFFVGFRIAPPFTDDYYPLELCSYVLIKGATSRLHKRLIKKDRLATYLSGGIEIRKDRAVFKLFVIINNERNRERCQKAVFSEINKLRTNLLSSEEMTKAKMMLKSDYLNKIANASGRAVFLANKFWDGPVSDDIHSELNRFMSVTPHRLMIKANRYFSKYKVVLDVKIR